MIWDVSPVLFNWGSFQLKYYNLLFFMTTLGGFALFIWQMRVSWFVGWLSE